MLFHGMGLGFTLFHFPVLGGGIGLIISSCSLMLLLNLLRSFLFISIVDISAFSLSVLTSLLFIFIIFIFIV